MTVILATNGQQLQHWYSCQNLNPQDNASDRANRIFGNLDVNCDGEVSEQEFIKGCMQDEDLVETLRGDNDNDTE